MVERQGNIMRSRRGRRSEGLDTTEDQRGSRTKLQRNGKESSMKKARGEGGVLKNERQLQESERR